MEKDPDSPKTNVLTNLNLRANRLKGNIILGNYGVSILVIKFFTWLIKYW